MARLLLVDDDEMIREYVTMLLEEYGHEVETAPGGLDAVKLVRESREPYDLVVSDLQMPPGEWGGRWLVEQIRGTEVPILVLSERACGSKAVECIKAGASDFCDKSRMDQELMLKIEEILLSSRNEGDRIMDYFPSLQVLLGETWDAISDDTKRIIATSEQLYHDHSYDTDFDFSSSYNQLAKALEREANRLLLPGLWRSLAEAQLDLKVMQLNRKFVSFSTLDPDALEMTLGQIKHILMDPASVQAATQEGRVRLEEYNDLIAFFDTFPKLRNTSVHRDTFDLRSYEKLRTKIMGIGCNSPLAVMCRLR
jgi:DNA-binding response OmpR family regulator